MRSPAAGTGLNLSVRGWAPNPNDDAPWLLSALPPRSTSPEAAEKELPHPEAGAALAWGEGNGKAGSWRRSSTAMMRSPSSVTMTVRG